MSAADRMHRYVDVFELARTGGDVEGSAPFERLARLRPSLADVVGELAYALRGFVDDRGRPAAELDFRGTVQLTCDRCGRPLPFTLAGSARYYFVRTEDELARIPVDDTADEPLLGAARFDLLDLVEDEAILGLPISPRHADCEAGAVSAPALADDAARPHPFAALARLKSRRQ
jgi:uncharacterized protein